MNDLKDANVRTTHDLKEIVQLFTLALDSDATVNVWYFKNEQRFVHFAKLLEVSEDKTILEIVEDEKNPFTFEKDLSIFFRIDFQNMIFKRDRVALEEGNLSIKTPTEIRLVERRKHQRFNYQYNDHKEFSYKKESLVEPEKKNTLFGNLINISEEGCAFVIEEKKYEECFLKECDGISDKYYGEIIRGQKIDIEGLTDQKLPSNFMCKSIYSQKYAKNDEGVSEVRIGVKFDDLIPHLEYYSVNESNRQKLEREKTQNAELKKIVQELGIQGYCGLSVGEQEKLFKDLEKKEDKLLPQLKENIELIEQLEYLTKGMKINLFRDLKTSTLALALRLCRKFVNITIMKDLSENIREEFTFQMSKKQPLGIVVEAQKELVKYIQDNEKSGDIYLDPEAYNKEV